MNLSRPLNMLVLFVPFILFPPDAKYLKRFNDLIMLKQVITKEIQTSLLMPKKGIPKSEFMARSSEIKVLNSQEIEGIKKACKITREVLDIAAKAVRVGITTDEIDRIVHEATIERGAYPSPLNYNYFPKSCCTSLNEGK
ncbi:hypothetical protein G6F35_015275 [Rhizopus arrhizus]|nr:hypothetical protein G6F35_015275 [Rhizopus arrhizus]